MKIKGGKTRYSKAELEKAKQDANTQIVGELAGRLMEGDSMSSAETNFASSVLRSSKPEGSICHIDLATIPASQDFIFRNLYIAYYADLDGEYGVEKVTGVVSREEKREDVIRLNEYFRDWKKVYLKNNHSENLLNLVINESTKEYKELRQMLSRSQITQAEFDYKEKSIVLHSKYLYITAKAFFDEHQSDEVIAKFHGREIIINEFSFVHIFNRHLAGAAKQFDTQKSFHMDREMKWFELPYDLKGIIESMAGHPDTNVADLKFLPFKFNGVLYAMWTEQKSKHKAGKAIPIIRLQSCYPIDDAAELKKVKDMYREVVINSKLSAFVPI